MYVHIFIIVFCVFHTYKNTIRFKFGWVISVPGVILPFVGTVIGNVHLKRVTLKWNEKRYSLVALNGIVLKGSNISHKFHNYSAGHK